MEIIGVEVAATVRSCGALPTAAARALATATASAILHKKDPGPNRLTNSVELP